MYLTMDGEELTPFPLRSGVLFTDAEDGHDKIGLTSFRGADCEVGDWWLRDGDWAYVVFGQEAKVMAIAQFGVQEGERFLGGFQPMDVTPMLDSFEASDGGSAEGEVAFEGDLDDEPRGSATFSVPYCGVQEQ